MQTDKIKNYILIVVLALISFAIYANSLHGDFLIDDAGGVLYNARIHDLKAYFSGDFHIAPGCLWQLANVFNWQVSGLNPYYYHLFNVLVNALCVVLFFILCNILFGSQRLSFFSSLIFAIHPLHSEAVSWISAGHYPFSSLFFISSMIFYCLADRSILNFILSLAFYVLGISAGNATFVLPLMFIVYELFFKKVSVGNKPSRNFRILTISLMLVLSFIFMAAVFIARENYLHYVFSKAGPAYLIAATKQIVYYLKILYMPVERGLYHPFGYTTVGLQKISPAFFGGLSVIFIAIFLFFRCRRKNPALSFGIAWFFICYLPYSNIIPVCNIIAERYMYLASAGYSIIMAYVILKIWEFINNRMRERYIFRVFAVIAITLFLSSYCLLTVKNNEDFSNVVTFWETNINNFPQGCRVYNSLAGRFYALGNLDQAIAYCRVNLFIKPEQPQVWSNLARAYRAKGDFKQAAECYKKALEIEKDYAPAQRGLEEILSLTRKQ
ncbi:MAG: tetratricopeptide repeat protein [Candidatus Omnitrophica bacterium]|nr:tetratricopeptide repeat protein [Candidatus Omnitrophota bacterium]